jgi:hypothetical protein
VVGGGGDGSIGEFGPEGATELVTVVPCPLEAVGSGGAGEDAAAVF